MCIPYMRRQAEKRTDRIMETSPNGIVLLKGDLSILGMNPAFKKIFSCSDAFLGKKISLLLDPEPFEKLTVRETEQIEDVVTLHDSGIIVRRFLYALREEQQYVGIFINITSTVSNKKKYEALQNETILRA